MSLMEGAVTPRIASVVFELVAPLPPFCEPWSLVAEELTFKDPIVLYAARIDQRWPGLVG